MEILSLANFRINLKRNAPFIYLLVVAPLILLLPWILLKKPDDLAHCEEETRFWHLGKHAYNFIFKNNTPKKEPKANFPKIIWNFMKKVCKA